MRLTTCGILIVVGGAISITAFVYGKPVRPQLFGGFLPGGPIVLMGVIGLAKQARLHMILGASLGGLMAVVVPYVLIFMPSGGGANIGLAVMLLTMPVYLPIAMIIGACVSHYVNRKFNNRPSERDG
jgi:hypothetical protein